MEMSQLRAPAALPSGKNPGTLVDPRASLDVLEEGNISCPYQDLNPGPYSLQPICYNDYTTLAFSERVRNFKSNVHKILICDTQVICIFGNGHSVSCQKIFFRPVLSSIMQLLLDWVTSQDFHQWVFGSSWTFWILKMRPLCLLKMLGIKYPVTLCQSS